MDFRFLCSTRLSAAPRAQVLGIFYFIFLVILPLEICFSIGNGQEVRASAWAWSVGCSARDAWSAVLGEGAPNESCTALTQIAGQL